MRSIPRISLSTCIALFCILSVAVPLGITLPLIIGISRATTERQNSEVLSSRGLMASVRLSRVLDDEWFKLKNLGPFITQGDDLPTMRLRFNTVKATDARAAWFGFADTGGKIAVASGGILEGTSVLLRPWFNAGIAGAFAGDRHEAVLLAPFLTTTSSGPLRLINMAMPVRHGDDTLAGVMDVHIEWSWVRNFVREFGGDNGIDVLLVSRQREVLVGPAELEGTTLSMPSVLAAGQGASITNTETWPDGQRYLVTVVPVTGYRDVPSFGWSLIVRQRADGAFAAARSVTGQALPILLAVGIALVILALFIGRILARPLDRLATAATEMAHGRFAEPIPDERRYREAALLSSALARLQSMVNRETVASTVVLDPRRRSPAA